MPEITQIINVQITRILKGEVAESYLKHSKEEIEQKCKEQYSSVIDCDDMSVQVQNFC